MIWFNLIIVVQVISALAIIGLVLMQHGKGADMGAAFGSGASGSLFGASGSSNFLSKSTGVAAAIFFGTTLALAYIGNSGSSGTGGGVMGRVPATQAPATGIPGGAPAQTAPADVPTLPAGSAAPAAAVPTAPAAPAADVPAAPAAATPGN